MAQKRPSPSDEPDNPSRHRTPVPSSEFTRGVIQAFFHVYNELGFGLPERYYSRALEMVLRERGFRVEREVPFRVFFHGRYLGLKRADLVINDCLVIENKTGGKLPPGSQEQLINCLRRSPHQLGLLFYFGPAPDFKRVIYSGTTC